MATHRQFQHDLDGYIKDARERSQLSNVPPAARSYGDTAATNCQSEPRPNPSPARAEQHAGMASIPPTEQRRIQSGTETRPNFDQSPFADRRGPSPQRTPPPIPVSRQPVRIIARRQTVLDRCDAYCRKVFWSWTKLDRAAGGQDRQGSLVPMTVVAISLLIFVF